MLGPLNMVLFREAIEDNYLCGVPVKKGTKININWIGNHFNPEYFEDPYEFRPERWNSINETVQSYVLGGFSGGQRTCIGKNFAKLESKIALIKFMKRYERITLPKDNYKMIYGVTYKPE